MSNDLLYIAIVRCICVFVAGGRLLPFFSRRLSEVRFDRGRRKPNTADSRSMLRCGRIPSADCNHCHCISVEEKANSFKQRYFYGVRQHILVHTSKRYGFLICAAETFYKLETISIAEPLQNRQHARLMLSTLERKGKRER